MRSLKLSRRGGLDGHRIFAEGGNNVAITLTPGDSGILKVIAGGEVIFDKDIEGTHPELTRVKEMRTEIRKKIQK